MGRHTGIGSGIDYVEERIDLRRKQPGATISRLIRRADDLGVFVLLDPMMPSRLATAFPEGVTVQRVGLADAVAETRAFLTPEAKPVGDPAPDRRRSD